MKLHCIAIIDKQFYEKLWYDLISFSSVGLFPGVISPWVCKRIIEIFPKTICYSCCQFHSSHRFTYVPTAKPWHEVFWPDWIIIMQVTANRILTRFHSRAHCVPWWSSHRILEELLVSLLSRWLAEVASQLAVNTDLLVTGVSPTKLIHLMINNSWPVCLVVGRHWNSRWLRRHHSRAIF